MGVKSESFGNPSGLEDVNEAVKHASSLLSDYCTKPFICWKILVIKRVENFFFVLPECINTHKHEKCVAFNNCLIQNKISCHSVVT